jgi:hypothetical protein
MKLSIMWLYLRRLRRCVHICDVLMREGHLCVFAADRPCLRPAGFDAIAQGKNRTIKA